MSRPRTAAAGVLVGALLAAAPGAPALELPAGGLCPPHPAPGSEPGDAPPRDLLPGERIERPALRRLREYLPREVWRRRTAFFFAGQRLEIGPCQRRYPAPDAFERATRAGAGRARIDADGRLRDAPAAGLPFPPGSIAADDPAAGARLAWSHRHRWLAGGLHGRFRIRHVGPRGRVRSYEGELRWQPFEGLPELAALDPARRLAIAGRFLSPPALRGLAWRQLRPRAARADDVLVWLPASRRTRRAPPAPDAGIWMPDYEGVARGQPAALALPQRGGGLVHRGDPALLPVRRGFDGLLLDPAAWTWTLEELRDLVAPLNAGPQSGPRRFGPSGLSLADGVWDVRRAARLRALRRQPGAGPVRALELWVDVQTLAPLYAVARDAAGRVIEVAIHGGRFSADEPGAEPWPGAAPGTGAVLPVAQSVWSARGPGWTREWLELRTGPARGAELRELRSTRRLGR